MKRTEFARDQRSVVTRDALCYSKMLNERSCSGQTRISKSEIINKSETVSNDKDIKRVTKLGGASLLSPILWFWTFKHSNFGVVP